jgi:hypothetical protein
MKLTHSNIEHEFGGLSPGERRCLERWLRAAHAVGIDAVENLSQRRWPFSVDGIVIGVFVEDREAATWLVVQHDGRWAVACCANNAVSPSVESITDALARIYKPNDSALLDRATGVGDVVQSQVKIVGNQKED